MESIAALIASHPELDAEALEASYWAMQEDEDRPREYTDGERAAHDIVLAHLQHVGLRDWDGTAGELSDRSRSDLIAKTGIIEVVDETHAQPMVLLPLEVFENLLADFVLLSNMQARVAGDGNAQDFWLRRVQSRLAEDAARAAWLAAHPEERGSS
jgi:hypothetical protein